MAPISRVHSPHKKTHTLASLGKRLGLKRGQLLSVALFAFARQDLADQLTLTNEYLQRLDLARTQRESVHESANYRYA